MYNTSQNIIQNFPVATLKNSKVKLNLIQDYILCNPTYQKYYDFKMINEISYILFQINSQSPMCPLLLSHISITTFYPLNLHFDIYLGYN